MKKFFFLLPLFALLALTSCEKDDDHDHEVTINILEPSNGELISDASAVHIHIEVVADEEVHDVEIVLHTHEDPDTRIIDVDMHSHESKLTFEQDVDLSSYPSGQEFHLEVVACKDHDCTETISEEVTFSIQ